MFADVLCNVEESMCRMMAPFVSEDTLHLKKGPRSVFGGPNVSKIFCFCAEDKALLLLKRNFL